MKPIKMSRQELINLFPAPTSSVYKSPDGLNPFNAATKRLHRHVVNPSAKPSTGRISPAEFRRRHLGKSKK